MKKAINTLFFVLVAAMLLAQTQPDPRVLLNQGGAATGDVLKWDGTKWAPGTDNGTSPTIGAFQTTGTANAASISGTDIRIHSASATTPGAVDLEDGQVLGSGGKVLQNNLNAETTVLTLRNNAAAGADAGPGLQFQGGASNTTLMQVQSNLVGATAALGAQTYFLNRGSNNGLNTHLTFGTNRVTAANGFWRKETKQVTANYNVTSSFINRFGHYCIATAGVTLTMPLETDMADGVEVVVSNLTTSGADATVNTGAAYSEFMFDYDLDAGTGGNQFFAASLAVPAGKSYLLTTVDIGGTRYWRVSLQASAASGGGGGSYAIGAYQTTGTANAASISGTDIRIHSASATAPGAVDLTNDQVLGENTKIFQESNAAGISNPVVIRNPGVDGDDDGESLTFQGGASNTTTATIESVVRGGSIAGGSSLDLYTRTNDNTLRKGFSLSSDNVATIEGWEGGSVAIIGASLDVSASLANRKANFQFDAAGGSLTLPVPTNEGYIVHINSVVESGASGTVNTGAAYSEFAWDTDQDVSQGGNQFFTATLTVPPMQSVTLKSMSVGSNMCWKVVSSSIANVALAQKQSRLLTKQISSILPSFEAVGTNSVGFGGSSFTGSQTARSYANTNRFTKSRRLGYVSSATAGNRAGFSTFANIQMNDGFTYTMRFGVNARSTNCIGFFGLSAQNPPVAATTNISSGVNLIGVGWDATQTTLRIVNNDASGIATMTDLGASFPCNTTSTDWYDLTISCIPSGAGVSVTLTNLTSGQVYSQTVATNIPSNTTSLAGLYHISNNTDNAAVSFDFGGIYLETD